ncbi:DUF4011 domain-containing protein [Methanobrevibacter boviskoreani]|uniref:DUF4011 domain-containing protein n=1 Tax=Methanobrevibacter boviskoreani TaxID=1348249 RepID=UPI0006ACECE8|nr:DUF4011 domain-containing protein [Methanobrevibacter boviskoreani]
MEVNDIVDIKKQIESLRTNLLDMNLRNNLLNFRPRKKSIKVVDENIAELYGILVTNEKTMEFLSNSNIDDDFSVDDTWEINSFIKESHKDLYLQTDYDKDELRKKLSRLYDGSKTSIEERGYNNLYLALGFLEWTDVSYQESKYKAPLILIPLQIKRDSVSSPYRVSWNSEEVKYNISLEVKLKDQGIDLPSFDDLESKDELNNYLKSIQDIINSKTSNWRIVNDIYLDNFDFKKFVMYKDLDLSRWGNIKNNSIKTLFEVDESDRDFEDYGYDYEEEVSLMKSSDIFNVVDADSSQISVLKEVTEGNKNLVVEGPPGTGKSQTIVNIIAELMANDKKILFVSEKKAALEVVKSKLDSIGLGDGCLELYGRNTNKKDFLNELERVTKLDSVKINDKSIFNKVDEVKTDLNNYVNILHSSYGKTGLTYYELMGMLELNNQKLDKNNQEKYRFDVGSVSNLTKEDREIIVENLNEIKINYDQISPYHNNLWLDTNFRELNSSDYHEIGQNLESLINYSNKFSEFSENLHNLIGITKFENFDIDNSIAKIELLKPNLKLIEDEYLPEIIHDIGKFQSDVGVFGLDVGSEGLVDDIGSLIDEADSFSSDSFDIGDFDSCVSDYRLLDGEDDLVSVVDRISDFCVKSKGLDLDSFGLDVDLDGLRSSVDDLSGVLGSGFDFYFVDCDVFDGIVGRFDAFKSGFFESLLEDIGKFQSDVGVFGLDVGSEGLVDDIGSLIDEADSFSSDSFDIGDFDSCVSDYRLLDGEDDLVSVVDRISDFCVKSKGLDLDSFGLDVDLDGLRSSVDDLSGVLGSGFDFYFVDCDVFDGIVGRFDAFKSGSFDSLLKDIDKFQIRTKGIDKDVLRLNLNSMKINAENLLNDLDGLYLDYTKITDINDFEELVSNFKENKESIESSNLYPLLKDSNIRGKFKYFQEGKDSLIKRKFNSNFKEISKQFHGYYIEEVSDDKIVEDLGTLLSLNQKLTVLRDKILAYAKSNIDDNKIVVESENLLKWFKNLENIIKKLSNYKINTNVESLINDLNSISEASEFLNKIYTENSSCVSELEGIRDSLEDYQFKIIGNVFNCKFNRLVCLKNLLNHIVDENSSCVSELEGIRDSLEDYQFKIIGNVFNSKHNTLIEANYLLDTIKSYDSKGKYYFNDLWNSYKSSSETLLREFKIIKEFNDNYNSGFFNDTTLDFVNNGDFSILNENIDGIKRCKSKIFKNFNNINDKIDLSNKLEVSNLNLVDLNDFNKLIVTLRNNVDELHPLKLFVDCCNKYSNKFTENLINIIKEDKIKSDMFESIFLFNFANNALKDIFDDEKCLEEFNYKTHEEEIEKFKELDQNTLKLNRYRVKEALANKRPNINRKWSKSSPMGILKFQFSKKRCLMSIRRLLSNALDAIILLKPCFMMSPVSIAQYLPPEIFESYFDYVIFDEASQVEVSDAIGAMMRGKHYIVMGDTKQLPPTRFFESSLDIDDEDEDLNNVKDLESILHLCENSFERRVLRWHYRSRHQSLIEFSNYAFYNNELYVFPSPVKNSDDLGLKFMYNPNTVYEKGSKNIKEAEDVVEYAFNSFRKYGNSKSLGIGTFSIKQKQVIMDVLETKLKQHPELEQYFNEDGKEGFFVKNLENIQGDERDIILISVGYGKNSLGQLRLNFGPLNRDGGERRLNVLITRAREQCVIFSNFKSSDMAVDKIRSKGVKIFKDYLYFAETGKLPSSYLLDNDFDSDFERSVYDFLVDNGYEVEKQVGCANYRIDLAVVDNHNPDNYILGIECDGAMYHSSKVARDRDRLRQEVLEGLGWKLYRIWSTDWYHARDSAKKRLLNAVEYAYKNKNTINTKKEVTPDFDINVTIEPNNDLNDDEDSYFVPYTYWRYDSSLDTDLYYSILRMVKVEGPVHIDDIYDRIKIFNGNKATKKFKNLVSLVLSNLISKKEIKKDVNFYYGVDFDLSKIKVRNRDKPEIDRIYTKEVLLSIIYTLKIELALSKEDLIKESSINLGFKRLTSRVSQKLESSVNALLNDGFIIVDENSNLKLNEDKI